MRLKKSVILILSLLLLITGVALKFAVWDNPYILCRIAEGLDDPSASYYFILERIYSLSREGEFRDKITQNIENGNNAFLHDLYIRILGVSGYNKSLHALTQYYIRHQHDQGYKATLHYTIKSMGLIGDRSIKLFLETLLKKYDDLQVQVSESNVASALYLITGKYSYSFANSTGEEQKLILTNALINARNVIFKSKGRNRTLEEMIILDFVFRPPNWRAK